MAHENPHQGHASSAAGPNLSLDFEVSNRCTITTFDALRDSTFRYVLVQEGESSCINLCVENRLTWQPPDTERRRQDHHHHQRLLSSCQL